jgi:NADPH-dependent curcumin reductase CurA
MACEWGCFITPQSIVEAKEELFRLHREGGLTALVDSRKFNGLDSIPDAIEYMLSGTTIGKVVVEL